MVLLRIFNLPEGSGFQEILSIISIFSIFSITSISSISSITSIFSIFSIFFIFSTVFPQHHLHFLLRIHFFPQKYDENPTRSTTRIPLNRFLGTSIVLETVENRI